MTGNTRNKKFRTWLKKYFEELLIVAGFVLILIGSFQIKPVVAWFVGGLEFLIYAGLLGWSHRK